MKLFIKNMVCIRCKMVVKSELEKLGLNYVTVELGEANIIGDITEEQQEYFRIALRRSGLELMDDPKAILIQKIKAIIVELVHYSTEPLTKTFSIYLSEKMNHEYGYLSKLFSEVEGITLERYFITHKIERVKELLVYDQLTLTEIANIMNYSSVAHLSTQFKKITALTPSHFKGLKEIRSSILNNK